MTPILDEPPVLAVLGSPYILAWAVPVYLFICFLFWKRRGK